MSIQKPFLKWVGGKTQIIEQIIDMMPKEVGDYYEPFVGGGSVLLAYLSMVEQSRIRASGTINVSDLNNNLIDVYKCVQMYCDELWEILDEFINHYNSITRMKSLNRKTSSSSSRTKCILATSLEEALESKESYYYWMRAEYNKLISRDILTLQERLVRASLFIMLNKTGFRGIYRESDNGFNVPFGNYKNPNIATYEELSKVSVLVEGVQFRCESFEAAISRILSQHNKSFVYLDPPYAPMNSTSFVGYTKGGFTKHEELFNLIDTLNNTGHRIIMSNAKVPLVESYFTSYNQKCIECRRSINSKNPESTATEVIITNYDKID